jgi:hypothetical protein
VAELVISILVIEREERGMRHEAHVSPATSLGVAVVALFVGWTMLKARSVAPKPKPKPRWW